MRIPSRTFGTRAIAATAALVALTASSCTVDDSKPEAAANPTVPAAAPIAPGVTADTVKIGVAYPDMASIKAFVNIDVGDYEATYRALIDKVNAAGGINGRRIVPVFAKFNPIAPGASQESCVKLTQDEKVFAVLGNFVDSAQALCYVEANKTAIVAGMQTKEAYAKAQAPWFGENAGSDRSVMAVRAFEEQGQLAGRKVAVIGGAQDKPTVESAVVPALREKGIVPVATGYLSPGGLDPAAIAQQVGVLVEKAQAEGADTLFVMGSAVTALPPVLEKRSWRPKLLFADQPYGYLLDKGQHDFSLLNGSASAAAVLEWDDDPDIKDCIATLEAADPALKGKLVDPNTVQSGRPNPSSSLWGSCINVKLFTAIAGKAGPDLNYQTFQQAGFGLGSFHVPSYRDPATYGPGSANGAIPLRVHTYDPATHRYTPLT